MLSYKSFFDLSIEIGATKYLSTKYGAEIRAEIEKNLSDKGRLSFKY